MLSYSETDEEFSYEEYEYDYDYEYRGDINFDRELDYIWGLYNNLKNRFPYFHSDIDNFTSFILDPNKHVDVDIAIKDKDLDKFEEKYYTELQLTFDIINTIYYIDRKQWIKYCYLYNK